MKRKKSLLSLHLWLSLLVILQLYSCSCNVTLDFTINGNYSQLYDVNDEPDASDLITVTSGESVVLKFCADTSKVVSYRWEAGGLKIGTASSVIYKPVYTTDTIVQIILCINGNQNCKCRYIKVRGVMDTHIKSDVASELSARTVESADPIATVSPSPSRNEIVEPTPDPIALARSEVLDKKATVGLPAEITSQVMTCGESGADQINVRIIVRNNLVEISSFKIFVNGCGQLSLSLSGNGIDVSDIFPLTRGKNMLSLSALGARLPAGVYNLTMNTSTGGGCTDRYAPRFINAKDCDNVYDKSSPELSLDQQGNQYIHELKFSYR